MSLSSVRSETALRSRLFSSSRSFRRFTCSVFSPPNSWRHRSYVTSLTPIWRIASTMFWPCETRTSTCRSFATISSGLYRFLAIAVLLDVKDIPQVGPLQWGWITGALPTGTSVRAGGRGTAVPHSSAKYVYAWGRVTYVDGFGNERWTNFCHRYDTEAKEAKTGGGYVIPKEHGRHHDYGNDAN